MEGNALIPQVGDVVTTTGPYWGGEATVVETQLYPDHGLKINFRENASGVENWWWWDPENDGMTIVRRASDDPTPVPGDDKITIQEGRQFDSGSVRDSAEGKGRYDLLTLGFAHMLSRLALHMETGAAKYEERNWEKGQPLQVYLDSATRHLMKFVSGYQDEDHLTAVIWNLMALGETEFSLDASLDEAMCESGDHGGTPLAHK